jgi:hypothetical protein
VFPTQIHRDLTEQFEGGFEVFDYLLGKDVRIGKIAGFVRTYRRQKMSMCIWRG